MERHEILKQLNGIFIDTLDNENVVINDSTTANDVEEWDSLTHIELVVNIEKYFKVRFTSKEIQGWANIGQLIDSVQQKGV